ncbi:MAG: sialidase family protein [Planctomycetia bacterium]|nr:sialidase family protein [Planctomycetia bacterium]
MKKITRRDMLKQTGMAAGMILSVPAYIQAYGATKAPKIEVERIQNVSNQPEFFYGWPTVARRKDNGELIVTCSGGRQQHVCPFGRVDMFRSYDDGKTWSWPQTIYDGPTDDRDSGVCITDQGTLLVTTFTSSFYYEGVLEKEINRRKAGIKGRMTDEVFERWQATHRRINDEQRKNEADKSWMFRSEDDGVNWDARQKIAVSSPHGPVTGFNGRILFFGTGWINKEPLGVLASVDDGKSWNALGTIPVSKYRKPDGKFPFWNEPHGIELSPGKFLVQIRNEDEKETWQTESEDDGKTWSDPHSIGVKGFPSFLLRLKDGRLLMTYSYRHEPYCNRIRISEDEGKSWSDPIRLSEPGPERDLGYPSTVQLPDETLISVWYEADTLETPTSIRMAHWRLV